ncbi:MAG: polysaccharide deacetylase family protein [Flavobacteriales bacterium]|nr:polysaccharide deacetylase family protein [Flavobacteriales bacterium]
MMKQFFRSLNHIASEIYAERYILESPYVISVYLHKLYPTKADFTSLNGSINEGVTIGEFEALISYFRKRSFVFVDGPDLLDKNLDLTKKHIHVSFDDGYFNNHMALPILERHRAKATFYITTEHNRQGKYFWWDVLCRERAKQAKFTMAEQKAEVLCFYDLSWEEQYARLMAEFGEDALYGNNEMMRPMTREELVQFSRHPYVTIGNHTTNHQNLNLLNHLEAKDAIQDGKRYLESEVGKEVSSIAYPYGFYCDRVIRIAKDVGMQVGQSTETGVDKLIGMDRMAMKRNQLSGSYNIEDQCRQLHVNYSIFQQLKARFT